MRRLPAGVVVSAAVHAAAAVWVSAYPPAPAPPPPPPPAVIELVDLTAPPPVTAPVPEAAAVEVRFLDEQAAEAITELADPAAAGEPPAAIAMSDPGRSTERSPDRGDPRTSATDPAPGTRAEPGGPTPERHPLLDMRKGAPVRLTIGVPTGRWDGRARAPETYGPELDSGQLAPAGGGTHRSDQGPFTAQVARDGSVSLKDKRNFNIRFALPGKRAIGDGLSRWYDDPNKSVGSIMREPARPAPRLNLDESSGADRKPDHGETVAIVQGGFDLTDALMRRNGQDPYASKKLRFLDSTRDERVQIGNRHRQQQLARAAEIMQRNLDRLWAMLPDPAARRVALFELWDECAETGDDDLVTAGRAARALVIGFIRAKLPARRTTAYTAPELAALNRRRASRASFAPYE